MNPFKQVLSALPAFAAITITALLVRREFWPHQVLQSVSVPSTEVRNWDDLKSGGHRMGATNSAVTLVVFGDFECPACRRFALGAQAGLLHEFPDQVAVIFRHWPLERIHPLAYPAARAAECAAAHGRFEALHDQLFIDQDRLGRQTLTAFAVAAGVPDTVAFKSCAERTDRVPTIDADIDAAIDLGGRGTPTIVINGRRLDAVPDSARLAAMVRDLLD